MNIHISRALNLAALSLAVVLMTSACKLSVGTGSVRTDPPDDETFARCTENCDKQEEECEKHPQTTIGQCAYQKKRCQNTCDAGYRENRKLK